MKILMTGGTGFVGSHLREGLVRMGHEVTVLTRSVRAGKYPAGVSFIEADPTVPGPWQKKVAGHDVIINLAGTTIFTYWTPKAKRAILESRVHTTRNVVDGIDASGGKEVLLISASAVGYYGMRKDDAILDESSPPGNDFVAEVSKKWEWEAMRAEKSGARVVLTRFGIVLGKKGGALSKMVPAFKYFLGSDLGSGDQWFSWIHEDDLLNIMTFVLEKPSVSGPVNCTAPNAVRNREMTRTVAKVLHRPVIMPATPAFLLKLVLGEFGKVLLEGQRVIPKKLLESGFQFRFPAIREAFENLLC